MPQNRIERIRRKVRSSRYDMSAHALKEMMEDELDLPDIKNAILFGRIHRIERDDPRGTRYTIEGPAVDSISWVGVVGRFVETGRFLMITVYEVGEIDE